VPNLEPRDDIWPTDTAPVIRQVEDGFEFVHLPWGFHQAGPRACFAGLWRPMPDGAGDAFTLLTTEPGPDVAQIHGRQTAVLERPDWRVWLELSRPEAGCCARRPRAA
jgi:putative SOS response-associated peptidase YedK